MILTLIVTTVVVAALYKYGVLRSVLNFVGYYGSLFFLGFLWAALMVSGHYILAAQLTLVLGTTLYAWSEVEQEKERKAEEKRRAYMDAWRGKE